MSGPKGDFAEFQTLFEKHGVASEVRGSARGWVIEVEARSDTKSYIVQFNFNDDFAFIDVEIQ